jgi:hypothetical protein
MAVNRVLNSDERETLLNSTRFKSQCTWALRNFASFWSNDDPSFISAQIAILNDYRRWAKNWIWANEALVADVKTTQNEVFIGFDIGLKGMNLWDSAVTPFNSETVIDYMIAQSKFDELSVIYVNAKTPTAVF